MSAHLAADTVLDNERTHREYLAACQFSFSLLQHRLEVAQLAVSTSPFRQLRRGRRVLLS